MPRAFTLIELLVVVGVIALMTILIFPSYRTGEQELSLQLSASKLVQNLRKTQEMAISAKEFQGDVPGGGYGIYFNISDPTRYILFADKDAGKDYDSPGERVETFTLEKNTRLGSLSPSGPLTVLFSPPDPTVYFYPDAAIVSITLEAERLSQQTTQYTYRRVNCGFFAYCFGWLTPRAGSCDISPWVAECPVSFSASAGDPQTAYDLFRSFGIRLSYRYQKQESQTTTYTQKTVEINKAGLIAID